VGRRRINKTTRTLSFIFYPPLSSILPDDEIGEDISRTHNYGGAGSTLKGKSLFVWIFQYNFSLLMSVLA
jgi:hypothetical protein